MLCTKSQQQLMLTMMIFVANISLEICSFCAIYFHWDPPSNLIAYYICLDILSICIYTSSVQSGSVTLVKLSSKLCFRFISGLLPPNCIRMSSAKICNVFNYNDDMIKIETNLQACCISISQ